MKVHKKDKIVTMLDPSQMELKISKEIFERQKKAEENENELMIPDEP